MNRHVLPIDDRRAGPSPALDIRRQDPGYERPGPVRPPEGAPNVLVVMIDDMGFGASSAFGGPCRMPTAERLADGGLRYTRFHTAAICAATRTALLTGRNHHSCGMGTVPEMGTAAPGYTGIRPHSTATVARMLQCNGYATGAFGKMHQTPPWEATPAGPYDRWPTHEGFDRFYGFLAAETNQFTPNLIDGVTPIDPPRSVEEGYHLSEDLVDQAIGWLDAVTTLDPAKPWFCYLSFGACHTPFHLPEGEWRERYRGEFAHGWDEQRARTLARQKELGVVPEDAELAPWAPGVPRWDELDDTQRTVAERLMELYAAFAEHTDAQVARLVEAIERMGRLEDTLVLYVLGDNGASAEGGLEGTLNEGVGVNGFTDTAERIAEQLDELGGPMTYAHYPVGWALAMDAPYQWTKQVASHYGGTRNGMIVHWPAGAGRGEVRHQWHHCIDVAPTILEVAGLPEPTMVDGVPQRPLEGVSFAYTFTAADAPERHLTQYFEMFGNRGIYDRGWTAVAKHRTPWRLGPTAQPAFSDDVWELYDTTRDWTQARDLAAEHPEKLEELKQRFLAEAARYQVLPLDDRSTERMNPAVAGRRDLMEGRSSMTLRPGMPGLPENAAPNVKNTSFVVTAAIDVPEKGADGVLVAQGGRFGGWALYVAGGRPCYCHNLCGLERMYVRAERALEPGRRTVRLRFDYDGGGFGAGGSAEISVDGEVIGVGRLERTTPFFFSFETLDVGLDRGTPVTEEYPAGRAGAFTGTIDSVRIDLGDDVLEPDAAERTRVVAATH